MIEANARTFPTLATPIRKQVPCAHRAGLDAVAGCVRGSRCGGLEDGGYVEPSGLIAISSLMLAGIAVTMYVGDKANTIGTRIATGMAEGSSLSIGVRKAMLYQMWLPYEATYTIVAGVMMITQLELAGQVSNEGVKLLAQFCAFVAGVTTAFGFVVIPAGLLQYRAKLRRTERGRA